MAKVLKKYKPKKRNVGRPRKYPWDRWLDGKTRRLIKGKDFKCELATIDDNARKAATARGLRVHVWREPERNAVVLQAYKPRN